MSSLPMHERVLQTQAQRLASFTEVASKRATSPVPLEPPSAKRPKRDSEKDEVVEEPPRCMLLVTVFLCRSYLL